MTSLYWIRTQVSSPSNCCATSCPIQAKENLHLSDMEILIEPLSMRLLALPYRWVSTRTRRNSSALAVELLLCCANPLMWRHRSWSTLSPDGIKPLPEPMLTNHQWGLGAFTEKQFHRECPRYQNHKFKITATSPRGQWVNHIVATPSMLDP